ncbi:MAG: hypothetical protein AAB373_01115 [Patescibacteria group bacterium]
MQKNKKAWLVVPFMLLALTACNKDDGAKTPEEEGTATEEETSAESDAFVSEAGKFSIVFPGEPVESSQAIPTAAGDIMMYMYMYEEGVTQAFMVSYSDYPADLVAASDSKTLLDGGKEGQLGALGTAPVLDKDEYIKMGEFDGTYMKAYGDGLYTVSKTVLAGNRLYQLLVMKDGSYPTQEEEDSFLGSFEITE